MFYTGIHDAKDVEDEEFFENIERIIEVMATDIPKKEWDTPEVIEAMERELSNYVKYDAFEEIEDIGQDKITSRWVCQRKEKQDGMKTKVKAHLVVRGFQEMADPRSDSPTISKDGLKIFLAICANEGFSIVNLDISNAYLQGMPLDRDVYVEPPKQMKKEGVIWKLKNA